MNVAMQQLDSWKPDRPVSRGASSYHDAVVNADYYVENLKELVRTVSKKIKENDIVVDFGAGTGVSALYLLKNLNFQFKLWLVDNSAAWLGKAYDIFKGNPNVSYFLLEKVKNRYATLAETLRNQVVDCVISSNTVHLIQNLDETFKGIIDSLKPGGTFTFQSGNILRKDREEGILVVDDTVKRVHDIAIDIVRTDNKFAKYRKDLDKRLELESEQRKFVFPDPKHIDTYLEKLNHVGFRNTVLNYKTIKIRYKDWLDFLRVKRLQAGILPEVGGKDASPEEADDRDALITQGADILFKELEEKNPMADDQSFTTEWIYVTSTKSN